MSRWPLLHNIFICCARRKCGWLGIISYFALADAKLWTSRLDWRIVLCYHEAQHLEVAVCVWGSAKYSRNLGNAYSGVIPHNYTLSISLMAAQPFACLLPPYFLPVALCPRANSAKSIKFGAGKLYSISSNRTKTVHNARHFYIRFSHVGWELRVRRHCREKCPRPTIRINRSIPSKLTLFKGVAESEIHCDRCRISYSTLNESILTSSSMSEPTEESILLMRLTIKNLPVASYKACSVPYLRRCIEFGPLCCMSVEPSAIVYMLLYPKTDLDIFSLNDEAT